MVTPVWLARAKIAGWSSATGRTRCHVYLTGQLWRSYTSWADLFWQIECSEVIQEGLRIGLVALAPNDKDGVLGLVRTQAHVRGTW